jgi:hypothetical protein
MKYSIFRIFLEIIHVHMKFKYKLEFQIEIKIAKVEAISNNMTHPAG